MRVLNQLAANGPYSFIKSWHSTLGHWSTGAPIKSIEYTVNFDVYFSITAQVQGKKKKRTFHEHKADRCASQILSIHFRQHLIFWRVGFEWMLYEGKIFTDGRGQKRVLGRTLASFVCSFVLFCFFFFVCFFKLETLHQLMPNIETCF